MIIYIILELTNDNYQQALVKTIIGIIFTCILQAFCQMNFGIISWIIVMIPIIFYTYITLLVFWVFELKMYKTNILQGTETTLTPQTTLTPSLLTPETTLTPKPKNNYIVPTMSPHESSTPIITTLYTPSFVNYSLYQTTQPPTILSPTSDNIQYQPQDIPNIVSPNIVSNVPGANFCGEFIKRTNHDTADDKNDCNEFSFCSWNGSDCITSNDYYKKVNDLSTHCTNLHATSCSVDDSCKIESNRCVPSKKGFFRLLNNDDCKTMVKKIHKSDEIINKQNNIIDINGCGDVEL
jgi:hypothetical protein